MARTPLKYLSVCSGIEAATVAWHSLGWTPWAFAEVDSFPSAVLAHHYPHVPNLGDITKWEQWPDATIDILVGGTPCQSFSVAGKRGGMDDARGKLALSFSAIAGRYKPRYVVWENVPGVLSSGGGRDFGAFLGSLVELGYGVCYRVLDAQYFGVAQRRRRVFVVGHLGDWHRAAAVLFERESLQRDSAKGGKARKGIAGNVAPSLTASNNPSRSPQSSEVTQQVAAVIEAQMAANPIVLMDQGGSVMSTLQDGTVGTLRREMHGHEPCVLAFAQNQLGEVRTGEVFNTINTNSNASGRNTPMVAFPANMSATQCASTEGVACNLQSKNPTAVAIGTDCYNGTITGDVAATMGTSGSSVNASGPTVMQAMQVRRLTPIECERLQGFPDGYTLVPYRNKAAADGPRYKALGNSMAVNCMAWIGERIAAVEGL